MNPALIVAFVYLVSHLVVALIALVCFMAALHLAFPRAVQRLLDMQLSHNESLRMPCPRCNLPARHFASWGEVEHEFHPYHEQQ